MEEIEIYIGCTSAQTLVAKVLAWSVISHTDRAVRFHNLHEYDYDIAMPKAARKPARHAIFISAIHDT